MAAVPRRLDLAFIGGGINSAVGASHFGAIQIDGRFRLAAGAFSRNPETNARTGDVWRVAPQRIYADYHQLIEAEAGRIDAVCLLTPSPDHERQICELFAAGIPVISEKPVALDLDGIARIRAIMDPEKHYLAAIFNYTGYPMLRELKARAERGDLGRIHQIMVEMPQESFSRPPDIAGKAAPIQHWRMHDGKVPMMCLDLGTHLHSLIHFITGEDAVEVMGEYRKTKLYPDLVGEAHMLARYPSGMLASFWFTKTAIGHRNGLRIRLYGEKASAEWYQFEPERLTMSLVSGDNVILDRASDNLVARQPQYNRMKPGHPSGFIEAFANYYLDIADDLEGRAEGRRNPNVFGIDEAAAGLALFEAAGRSSESGKWETIAS